MNKNIVPVVLMSINISVATLYEIIIDNPDFIIIMLPLLFIINWFFTSKLWNRLKISEKLKEDSGLIISNILSSIILISSIIYIKTYGVPLDTKYDPVLELIIVNLVILFLIILVNSFGIFFNKSYTVNSRLLSFTKYFFLNWVIAIISIVSYLIIGSGLTVGNLS